MAKPYSMDLRERVVEAVERDGLSCNQAAAPFGVAISAAIEWVNRYRQTASVAPCKMGGHRPKKLGCPYPAWLPQRCPASHFPWLGTGAPLVDLGPSACYP